MPRPNSTGPKRERNPNRPTGKSSGSRTRESGAGNGDKRRGKSFAKGKSDKPFGESRSGNSARPRKFEGDKPAGKGPSKKFDRANSEGTPSRDERRSFGARPQGDKPAGKKPFRKFEGDQTERPQPRGERRSFGARAQGDKPAGKKPFRKFDGDYSEASDSRRERPVFNTGERNDESREKRPFKKFDRSGVKRGGKKLREEAEQQPQVVGGPVRLNKYIANSGVCSRREADELITMGLISVNGKVVTTLGHKVNPGDEVRHENRVLRAEKPVYILMNKPKGFLTTTSDPEERSTVMNLVGGVIKERIYPVGRLDRNTTGLLVLTNDGDMAEKLMHPSYNVKKIYRVDLDRPLTKADATKIMEGINLEEGRAVVDDLAIVSDDKKTVGLEIHIGWNRVVRRIFESLDYKVVKLDRTMYAGLTKKDLPRGEWRFLTREEIVLLKHYK